MRTPSARRVTDEVLLERIRAIHRVPRHLWGAAHPGGNEQRDGEHQLRDHQGIPRSHGALTPRYAASGLGDHARGQVAPRGRDRQQAEQDTGCQRNDQGD